MGKRNRAMTRKLWPTDDELKRLQAEADARADECGDESDPICDCGEPGYACQCDEMGREIGFWPDGSEYDGGQDQ